MNQTPNPALDLLPLPLRRFFHPPLRGMQTNKGGKV
jgi:hypothetical protein